MSVPDFRLPLHSRPGHIVVAVVVVVDHVGGSGAAAVTACAVCVVH